MNSISSDVLMIETKSKVLCIGLNRPAKRNALNDRLILDLGAVLTEIPDGIGAVVIHGVGDHFSAGLDLSELTEHDATGGLMHSQMWHRVFDRIQYARVPVIAALRGAVIGGGLEMACAAHIRVADPTTYYALPEGSRGIFVGGGGSVRLPRLIGVARMTDMMLTGRVYSATEGAAYGFSQYLTEAGGAFDKAMELAERVVQNAPLTNFAVLQALPMIAEANPQTGLLMESLMATVAQSDKEAKARIRAFLDRKTAKSETDLMSGAQITLAQTHAAPLRPISFGVPAVSVEHRSDGAIFVRPTQPLGDYPLRITDRLLHWAREAPDRTFMAERDAQGGWRRATYAQMLASSRRIGSALLARNLSAERPLVILSGNSLDHALMAFGALYAGIPYCPVSPAYSLISKDYGKLGYLMKLLTPGLVFADDAAQFADALVSNVSSDIEIAASTGTVAGRTITSLAELRATPARDGIDAIHDAIEPDAIAKFLLTSGSTGNPKAVITTQRMLCANQVMIRETMSFLKDEPPVIVDWLPWNHTFGGSHNVGLTLYNGGVMYLDAGKPTPAGIHETIRNLREVSPTVYFNVPKGYESLLPYLRDDAALRETFFTKLHAMFFSGAALAPHIWGGIDDLAVQATGARVPMLTGLGSTETAPFFMSVAPHTSRSGHVGLPVTGNDAKLVPNNGKWEVRCKGPNVTPGYWREPELTAKAFDEEGFYRLGDALKLAVAGDFDQGFDFDGRISEDFKLASGTWVSVGPLRARLIAACAPLARDVVIAGINRDEISAIVILDPDGCRDIDPALTSDDVAAAAADPAIRAAFRSRLTRFAGEATGSSNRVTRAVLLDAPLSIDRGEVTDKGSINQRAVLDNRAALIEALYAEPPDARVIVAGAAAG